MKFTNPPAAHQPKYMTTEVVEALRDNAGEWALAFEQVSPKARSAIAGWVKRHPGFELTSRGGQTVDVYVRYVGDPS